MAEEVIEKSEKVNKKSSKIPGPFYNYFYKSPVFCI
jgi:hypothetical protein